MSDKYVDLGIIGRGSFGVARKVRNRHTGEILVRKEINYRSLSPKEVNQIASEFLILKSLRHPNIVQVKNSEENQKDKLLYMYMEYCDGGDLSDVIKQFKENNQRIPETLIWQVFTQLLLALYRCHNGVDIQPVTQIFQNTQEIQPSRENVQQTVIHRDIKPENVFFMSNKYTVKLGDFGLAKCLSSHTQFTQTYVGTPYYMPPELIKEQAYNPVCDIWSLGCVIYEMCCLKPPFTAKTHAQLQERIQFDQPKPIPSIYSQRLQLCINACLIKDPIERVDANRLLQEVSFKVFRKEWELTQREIMLSEKEMELGKWGLEVKKIENKLIKKQQDLSMIEKRNHEWQSELESTAKELSRENQRARDLMKREFNLYVQKYIDVSTNLLPPELIRKQRELAERMRRDPNDIVNDYKRFR